MEKEKKEPCEAYIKRESVKPEHKRGKWIKYGPRRAKDTYAFFGTDLPCVLLTDQATIEGDKNAR